MENTVQKHAVHGFSQFRLTNYLLNNLSQFNITPIAKLVLLELSACYNPKKADMFPKQKTLAKKIGVSERSVVRGIQELMKAGLILVESKYTNHYIFTSRIAFIPSQNERLGEPDKTSDDLRQNDTSLRDNLSHHEHEQIKEHDNQPPSVDDFKILKEYAEKKGAKNITSYVAALKRNGAADKIIKEIKEKERANNYYAKQIEQTAKMNEQNRIWVAENPNDCAKLREVLRKNWGICK